MKLEMTQKDKKLLIGLSIFVIVVCIGYWGILPVIKSIRQIDKDIVAEQEKSEINEMKVRELPLMEMENEELEAEIIGLKTDYYPMMNTDEIDKYFTTMALGYQLNTYALDISMPQSEASKKAYQYSEKYQEDLLAEAEQPVATTDAAQSSIAQADAAANEAAGLTGTAMFEDEIMTGIYEARISMRLGGREEDLKKLINDYSVCKEKILITNYSWGTDRGINFTEDGLYEVTANRVLNITFAIYMCKD